MNAITFDTLKFARTLQEQGKFTPEQSSSLVEALGDVLASDLAAKSDVREIELALKHDLRETELALKHDLREAELRLEAKIADVKADIVKWLFGTVGFQTLIILGAVIALARAVH
jgi:hypothetical protein